MKVFLGLGKAGAVLFWLVVLANLLDPFAQPFDLLLRLGGGLILLTHVLELLLFGARLKGRPRPWRDRLQVLLFGVFHLLALPQPRAKEAGHA